MSDFRDLGNLEWAKTKRVPCGRCGQGSWLTLASIPDDDVLCPKCGDETAAARIEDWERRHPVRRGIAGNVLR